MCAGVILGAWGGTVYGSVVGSGIDCADPRPLRKNRRRRQQLAVKRIAVTASSFLTLTDDGRVFQIGGESWDGEEQLVLAREGDPVLEIAAGRGHMVALCKSGRLFTWGDNTAGQCGHPDAREEYIHNPRQVAYFTSLLQKDESLKVVHIACALYSTIVATRNGHVFAFGGADDASILGWPKTRAPKRVRGVKIEGKCRIVAADNAFFLVSSGNGQEAEDADHDFVRKLSLGKEEDSAALAAANASTTAGAAMTTVAAAAAAAAAATTALGKGAVEEGESLVVSLL